MKFANIVEAIGHTPLVELQRFSPRAGRAHLRQAGGAQPDRQRQGPDRPDADRGRRAGRARSAPDTILLEPTSGNTGIGLAMIAQVKGYRLKVVMPDNVSVERRQLLELFGAEIELTDGAPGSNGSIARAQELAKDPRYHLLVPVREPGQPARPLRDDRARDHRGPARRWTSSWRAWDGRHADGRRASGCKEHNPNVQIVAAEPHPEDQVSGLRSLDHGFIPPILDLDMLDRKIVVRARRRAEVHARAGAPRGHLRRAVRAARRSHVALRVAERDGTWYHRGAAGRWRLEVSLDRPVGASEQTRPPRGFAAASCGTRDG